MIGDQAAGTPEPEPTRQAGLEGTLLSVIVLFFFLRDWPSTLMVSLAIPICFVITLGCMQMFGMTLNILSMMGLLLAVGMLVDNAVVVVESIYHYRERYPDKPWYCAVQGTQVVGIAIAAGTLSSIIVFLPMVFGENNGISVFLTQVAVTMAIAHLASWLVAVSLVPMLSARLPPPKFIGRKSIITRVQGAYGRFVALTLRHRRWTMTASRAAGAQRPAAGREHEGRHVPNGDGDPTVCIMLSLQRAVSAERDQPVARQSKAYLRRTAGNSTSATSTPFFKEQGNGNTDIFDDSDDGKSRYEEDLERCARTCRSSRSAKSLFDRRQRSQRRRQHDRSDPRRGFGQGAARPCGGDQACCRNCRASATSRDRQQQPGDERSRGPRKGEDLRIFGKRCRAFIAIALRGQQLKDFHGSDAAGAGMAALPGPTPRASMTCAIQGAPPRGAQVPLMAMVEVRQATAPSAIERRTGRLARHRRQSRRRQDKRRCAPGDRGGDEEHAMPAGYRWSFGENFDRTEDASKTMMFNVIVALVLVYVVMCAMFESLIYPAAILTTFVFSIFGVYWLFWITGNVFSIMALIGVLILMGVVVNNGIVMIVHINQLRHKGLIGARP